MSYVSKWLIGVDIWKGISHVLWLFRIFKMYFLLMHRIFKSRSLIRYKCYVSNSKHMQYVGKSVSSAIFLTTENVQIWKMQPEDCEGRSSLHLPSKGPSEIKQILCFDGANKWKCRLLSCAPKFCKHVCIRSYLWGFLTLSRCIIKTNVLVFKVGLDVAW